MDGRKTSFLLGWLPGICYVSFREGISFYCSKRNERKFKTGIPISPTQIQGRSLNMKKKGVKKLQAVHSKDLQNDPIVAPTPGFHFTPGSNPHLQDFEMLVGVNPSAYISQNWAEVKSSTYFTSKQQVVLVTSTQLLPFCVNGSVGTDWFVWRGDALEMVSLLKRRHRVTQVLKMKPLNGHELTISTLQPRMQEPPSLQAAAWL